MLFYFRFQNVLSYFTDICLFKLKSSLFGGNAFILNSQTDTLMNVSQSIHKLYFLEIQILKDVN